MYINIDDKASTPIYMQIYKAIKDKIINKAFKTGDKLPSKRALAVDLGVSVSTVEHAYAVLCDEDYCETRQRSGCYVIYSDERNFPSRSVAHAEITPTKEDVHFDAVPFSVFAARMRRVIADYGERILQKSPHNGCMELRGAICRYLERSRNIKVKPSQVVIGSGAEYLYGLCIKMLGSSNRIALEDPSYEKIRAVYEADGAVCEMLPMDSEGIRSAALRKCSASILHVTPFNSFPSGITASAARRREYINWAKERGAVIIEDDYDSEFILTGKAPETLFSMSPKDGVIYVNTFSKTIAPAIRAGYMLLPENMLNLYERKIGFYSCSVPMFEQFFLAEWINSGDFERNISRMRHRVIQKNQT